MKESIEDRIIAYFDGRLTDDESADLLHRVSVSPEIRKLFREHEMLRDLAHTAQASAVVRPEVESSLFARIEAIAASEAGVPSPVAVVEEKRKRRVAPIFWTRWRLGLATAVGAFLIGTAVTMGPEWFGNDDTLSAVDSNTPSAPRDLRDLGASSSKDNTSTTPTTSPDDFVAPREYASEALQSRKTDFNKQIRGDRDYDKRIALSERPKAVGSNTFGVSNGTLNISDNSASTSSADAAALAASDQTINTAVIYPQPMPINVGGEKGIAPPFRAVDIDQEGPDRFEVALESSTGFAYPASDPGVTPFADSRLSFGYFIDNNNIVGVRGTYGLFEVLPDEATASFNGTYTTNSRDLETKRLFSPGVYFTHREYSVLGEYINLDATVGAGYLINAGYTLSGEVGLRFPFSSRLNGAISFGLTRVHINAPSMDEMMQNVTMNGPVIFEGSDVRNTLNGRIQYGLSYQF